MNKNNFWLNDIFLIALSLFLLSIISTCSSKAQNDFSLDIRFIETNGSWLRVIDSKSVGCSVKVQYQLQTIITFKNQNGCGYFEQTDYQIVDELKADVNKWFVTAPQANGSTQIILPKMHVTFQDPMFIYLPSIYKK